MEAKVKEIVSQMTIREKADLLSGKNFWEIKENEKLGLKSQMLTDGPHGLRKQAGDADHLGINNSEPATCFPSAAATACSFNPELLYEMGESLGDKCIRENVAVILGPGVNIKRSPLCGRNFEYFSEDPYLAGEMGAALVQGVQSKGVGTSVKHFAANSQEYARMVSDSVVDERALREIYLSAFERVVKKAQPWTVMCSYNKINGTYASNNKWLLTDVLRDEWGYENLVVTDWGAMDDPVKGVLAGCDLEMPFSGDSNARKIVQAVENGSLSEEAVNKCVERVVDLYLKAQKDKKSLRTEEEDNELAKRVSMESSVLLKNDSVLPLTDDEEILIVGEMAEKARYQGAGSSKINPSFLDSILGAAREQGKKVKYSRGYVLGEKGIDENLLTEAVELANTVKKVIIVAGLPDEYESEGYDRDNMDMPESHNRLIEEIAKVCENVVVVLQCGSPVTLPWKDKVKGILLTYLSGQTGGSATVDLLYGKENPSGKLAESWPVSLEQNPSYEYYQGTLKRVLYKESIFVGYRYYDTVKAEINYPFGYGLSYTNFEYSNLKVSEDGKEGYKVSFDITNTGNADGKEIAELYISKESSSIFRASHELKGFKKIFLKAGETKSIEIELGKDAFRYYNVPAKAFCVEGGEYKISIGKSSRNIVLEDTVEITGDNKETLLTDTYGSLSEYNKLSNPISVSDEQFVKLLGHELPSGELTKKGEFTDSSCLTEIKDTLAGKMMLKAISKQAGGLMGDDSDEGMKRMAEAMLFQMPLRAMTMTGAMTHEQVEGLIAMANGRFLKGLSMMRKKD